MPRAPWLAVVAVLFGCAGARPSAGTERGCASSAECGPDQECHPPGEPTCGGADWSPDPPPGGCPTDRPHWAFTGCRHDCVAEPPASCSEGFSCPSHASCSPGASGSDVHGCARAACARDAECGEGRCVERRCYDALGTCEPLPV